MPIRNLRPEWGEFMRFRGPSDMEEYLLKRNYKMPPDGLKLDRDYERIGRRPGNPPRKGIKLRNPELTKNELLKDDLAWEYAYSHAGHIRRKARKILDKSIMLDEWPKAVALLKNLYADAQVFKPENLVGEAFAEYSADGTAEAITDRMKRTLTLLLDIIEKFEEEHAEREKIVNFMEAIDTSEDVAFMLKRRCKRGGWANRSVWYVKMVTPRNLDVVRVKLGAVTEYARMNLENLLTEYSEDIITTRRLTVSDFITPDEYRRL